MALDPRQAFLSELARHCRGELATEAGVLAAFGRDFGGMVVRSPLAALRPASVDDVARALQIAAQHGVCVTTRGAGHGQSGQSVGEGLVLDMRGLNRITRFSDERHTVEVEAGAAWKDVVDASFARGLLPLGLTHVLDTTVAGTLSIGGVGAESWKVGPQVDNVQFLDVVTLDGRIQRVSDNDGAELFNVMRAGVGQCGVVVAAGYPVRRCCPRLRARYLLYRSSERFVEAAQAACRGLGAFVSGVVMKGARSNHPWRYMLVIGVEHDGVPQPAAMDAIGSLAPEAELPEKDTPVWHSSGVPGHIFFRLYEPEPGTLDAQPGTLHPWVDHIYPRTEIHSALERLADRHAALLEISTCLLIMIRRGASPSPLFVVPEHDDLLFGLGLFPSLPPSARDEALRLVRGFSREGVAGGGKRYLSGYLEFNDVASWAEHYGSSWRLLVEAKNRHDPDQLLNRGFVHYP